MLALTTKFNQNIEGEKLLYNKTEEFTQEESEQIVRAVFDGLTYNCYYSGILYQFKDVLYNEVFPKLKDNNLLYEKRHIKTYLERIEQLKESDREEELDYAIYWNLISNGSTKEYVQTINEDVMDAVEYESIINNGWSMLLYKPTIKFLVTSNLLFARHPKFFEDEYVSNLSELLHNVKKSDFSDKNEYKKYKTAEKATLNHIKKYYRNKKEESKKVAKVKKL